jgi:hypothetical protein
LLAITTEIVVSWIAPPIPTALRIACDLARIREAKPRRSLRVKNDDMMGVRPDIVSGVSEEQAVDFVDVLLATVKGHVQTALCPGVRVVFAVRRH